MSTAGAVRPPGARAGRRSRTVPGDLQTDPHTDLHTDPHTEPHTEPHTDPHRRREDLPW